MEEIVTRCPVEGQLDDSTNEMQVKRKGVWTGRSSDSTLLLLSSVWVTGRCSSLLLLEFGGHGKSRIGNLKIPIQPQAFSSSFISLQHMVICKGDRLGPCNLRPGILGRDRKACRPHTVCLSRQHQLSKMLQYGIDCAGHLLDEPCN
jgi:hypothetical protein